MSVLSALATSSDGPSGPSFGQEPVFLRCGGTVPVVNTLYETPWHPNSIDGLRAAGRRHSGPNEKFHLPNFFRGIATSVLFMAGMSKRAEPAWTERSFSHDY
jgi:hypothetical protein